MDETRLGAARLIFRIAAESFFRLRRATWRITRPTVFGTRAIALSDQEQVVLVRHSYMPGWHLPGGSRKRGEAPEAAILRELTEEIGLIDYQSMTHVGDYDASFHFRTDTISLFLLRGVRYRANPSIEIAEIAEFPLSELPEQAWVNTRARIDELLGDRPISTIW